MKKVKIHKKWKIKKSRNKKKTKKCLIIILSLLIYIIIIPLIIISIIKRKRYLKKKEKIEKYFLSNSSDEMYYKGEKVSKSKLIEDYLVNITNKNKFEKKIEKEKFNKFYYLPEYSDDPDIQEAIRKKVYEVISNIRNKTINKIEKIFVSRINPFGNNVVCVNNAIFYCEVLGCTQIILNDHTQRKWLIRNPVYIKNLNITIFQGPRVNCNDDNILCIYHIWDILYPFLLKPEVRIQYLKDEILRNLPAINMDPDDLYIHIRGGDVFRVAPVPMYGQPPLCFYERIMKSFKFKNIYIVANDQKNTVFHTLIKKYPNIIYQKNGLEHDISLLTHAFNIVLSISSFSLSSIKFNDNLKNVYEFDLYRLTEKFVLLHHHVYKFDIKYKIYSMKPSERYRSKMFNWVYSSKQRGLMLNDNCPYDFTVIKPN